MPEQPILETVDLRPARRPGGAQGGREPDALAGLSIFAWLVDGTTIRLDPAADDATLAAAAFVVPWAAVEWWIPI